MNINLLNDDDVKIVEDGSISLVVIHVPRADFNMCPVYVGENPYKGTYKRNHEGDYYATEHEIRGMIRDQNPEGNDNQIIEYYSMDDIDKETLRKYRQIFEIRNDGHVWNSILTLIVHFYFPLNVHIFLSFTNNGVFKEVKLV